MLKYINKQLTKSESYEVEKHMVDCELCTDAMAGMKFATNSSILFTLDHQIDKRAAKGSGKVAIMKNLMVAASVLIVVFGAYFTYNLFNNTTETELAIHVENKIMDENNPIENFILQPVEDSVYLKPERKKEEFGYQSENLEIIPIVPEVVAAEEIEPEPLDQQISSESIAPEDVVADIKVISIGDELDLEMDMNEELVTNFNAKGLDLDNATIGNSFSTNDGNGFVNSNIGVNEQEKIRLSSNLFQGTSNKKARAKSKKFEHQNTIYIEGYKAYDYAEEYQNAEDFKRSALPKSIPPDYSTKEDKARADKELEKITIKITYQETLERGIHNFKLGNYQEALIQFDLILIKHPKDVNALFYGGLSNYHTQKYEKSTRQLELVLKNKRTEFNQEAEWYNALTLIELKKEKKAKKLLEKIITDDSFYKSKAVDKLKEL